MPRASAIAGPGAGAGPRPLRRQRQGARAGAAPARASARHWVPKTAVAKNAPEYKERVEAQITKLKAEASALAGKENHALRSQKNKLIADLRADFVYIDACRVAHGQAPLHGHFALGAEPPKDVELTAEEAARLAAEAEAKLAELAPPAEKPRTSGCLDEEVLERGWSERLAGLEAKLRERPGKPPVCSEDTEELEAIAREIVSYRIKLKAECGYRKRDLRADSRLHQLEDRLDAAAAALLPPAGEGEQAAAKAPAGADELREWERRLTAKLARHAKDTVGLSPSAAKEVQQLLTQITELKAELRAKGFTEHEQDKDERVLLRLVRLAELRQYRHTDKKHERHQKQELGTIREEVQQLHGKLEMHKKMLREEQGLTHTDVKKDAGVAELEERLAVLQNFLLRCGGA